MGGSDRSSGVALLFGTRRKKSEWCAAEGIRSPVDIHGSICRTLRSTMFRRSSVVYYVKRRDFVGVSDVVILDVLLKTVLL